MGIYTLLPEIVSMSVTAGLAILAVLLCRCLLRRGPKLFSYLLWSVVLFRLLCPVSVSSPFSALGLVRLPEASGKAAENASANPSGGERPEGITSQLAGENGTGAGYRDAENVLLSADKAGGENAAADSSTLAHPAPLYEEGLWMSGGAGAVNKSGLWLPQAGNPILPAVRTTGQSGNSDRADVPVWLKAAAWIWLAGIAGISACSMFSMLRLKRRLVGAVRAEGNIYQSDYIDSPFVVGVFRPRIYLPSSLCGKEREYIVLHERTHLRRGDHIFRLLAFAALTLHWFNPLVWLAFYLSGRDMEMACDETVMKRTSGDIRAEYSASLLGLATGRRMIPGIHLAFGEGEVGSRIRNVMQYKKPAAFWIVFAVLLFSGTVCAFGSDPAAQEGAAKKPGSEAGGAGSGEGSSGKNAGTGKNSEADAAGSSGGNDREGITGSSGNGTTGGKADDAEGGEKSSGKNAGTGKNGEADAAGNSGGSDKEGIAGSSGNGTVGGEADGAGGNGEKTGGSGAENSGGSSGSGKAGGNTAEGSGDGRQEADDLDKMLTVYSLAESELVHELIAGFQTMYPGVEIRYETGEAGLSAFEQADALTARLMAGNGPDVLIMDGLPANTYQNRGFLADLSPALASVREELQQNILSAYETDGGSFMLPVRYSVPVAVVKKQNAEVVGSLNKLMRYSGLQRGGVCAWGYSRKDFVELVYYNYTPEFILPDGSADEQDIRRESIELGNFLIWTKWLLENEKVKAGNQEHTYFTEGENTIGLFREEVELMFMPLSRMGQLRFYNPCVLAAGYGNIRYGATSLQLMDGIFFPEGLLGINAQSENRELAEQFVKAAFSFEMQSEYTAETGFQTNGRALTEAFLAQQEENQRMLESGGTKDTVRHMTEQRGTVERMFGAITSVKRPQTVNPAILEVLQEEAQDYFDGEEYLWDCVAAILERVQ